MTESSYHNDITDITQLLARYALNMSKGDYPGAATVFTPDATYSAFGQTHTLEEFPIYLKDAPHGLLVTSPPAIEIEGDTATGQQVMYFVDQATHETRLGYWTDEYRRTPDGWRVRSRSMTFMRRSGAYDSGKFVPKAASGAE
jgi:SnoaL-like domain